MAATSNSNVGGVDKVAQDSNGGGGGGSSAWADISGKPSTFAPTQSGVRGTPLTGLSTSNSADVEATDTILVAVGKLQAQVNAGGGGGAAVQDSLTEGENADEVAPSVAAVNEGLSSKRDDLAPVQITFSSNAASPSATAANRPTWSNTNTDSALTPPSSGVSDGDYFEHLNRGTGTITFPGVTVPAGCTASVGQNQLFTAIRDNGAWKSTTRSFSSVPAWITGDDQIGSDLEIELAEGWVATGYQWTRDDGEGAVNISGATSATYTKQNADAGHTVTCELTGIPFVPTGVLIEGELAPTEVEFEYEHENFTTTFGSGAHTYAFDHAIPADKDVVIVFMTNGVPTLSNPRDNNGVAYTLAYMSATTNSKRLYCYYRPKCQTAPTQFIIDSDIGTALRIQAIETTGMASTSTVSGTAAAASLGAVATTTHGITTGHDGALLVTMINTPGGGDSRVPVAVNPSQLHRLRTVSGNPYTGTVSEFFLSRTCGAAGAHTNSATLTEGVTTGNCTGFSVAFKPGL